jgi:hypothetical protein
VNVEPVMLTVALVLPSASMWSPSFPVPELLELKMLLVTVRFSVPLVSLMTALLSAEPCRCARSGA